MTPSTLAPATPWSTTLAAPLARLDALQSAVSRSASHVYTIRGRSYPSVTGITKMLPAPALDTWRDRVNRAQITEAAFENPPERGEDYKTFHARIDDLAGEPAHKQVSASTADRGTLVHAAIESVLTDGPIPEVFGLHAAMFNAWLSWWGTTSFTPVRAECLLVSEAHGFGGTADALLWDERRECLVLADWKTTKLSRIAWPNYRLQSAAYRECLRELGFPTPIGGLVLQLDRNGNGVAAHELETDFGVPLAAFLDLHEAKQRIDRADAAMKGGRR